ncbi:TPA: HK97 gp10 family phage protein [Staphylococcus aureus]|nr:HK97 gp10 family phage protein [Staphylococcus aureus]
MQVSGVDKLLRKFRKMYKDIDDDVDFILKNNANEGVEIAIKNAQHAFVKGYWTGNLARQIKAKKIAPLHYQILSNAHYSGYLEYGTRFMNKEPFIFPTYVTLKKQVNDDFKRLLNS